MRGDSEGREAGWYSYTERYANTDRYATTRRLTRRAPVHSANALEAHPARMPGGRAARRSGRRSGGRALRQPPVVRHLARPERRAAAARRGPDSRREVLADGRRRPRGVATGNPATGTSNGVPRLGVPTIYYSDGPVGPREGKATAMPAPIGLASSFDSALARRVGVTIADEVRKKGNDVVHAPTVDIMRTPLAGRTFEGYGEDPWLSSRLAVALDQGAQSQGVIGNVKHFAPNSQEGAPPGVPPLTSVVGGRFTVDARVDARTLREIYLPPFEAAVKEADVGTIMCAYNRLNGSPACENRELLEQILRGDWGFDGFVVADYGFATKSTAASANNGMELDMPQGFFYSQPNLAPRSRRGRSARRRSTCAWATSCARCSGSGRSTARPTRRTRPDRQGRPRRGRARGRGAGHGAAAKPGHAAAERRRAEVDRRDRRRRQRLQGRRRLWRSSRTPSAARARRSLAAPARRAGALRLRRRPRARAAVARGADVALVFASDTATEGVDKTSLATDDDALVEAVAAANPRTTVVLETAGPVLTPWRERVDAIVEAWYPGQAAGRAIARVLFGDTDPGGRLPATFPSRRRTCRRRRPEAYPGVIEVEHKEGVFVGYRHYDQRGLAPAYPVRARALVHVFSYRGLRIRKGRGNSAAVSVEVRNTGRRTGSEVAQLYLGLPDPGGIKQPPRALKGARKLTLRPGRRRRVGFVSTRAP